MEENYKIFGWRGINFEIPHNWGVGLINDTEKKGYLRFDDLKITRLELEWRKISNSFSLEKIIGRYIDILGKKAKKSGLKLEIKRNLKIASLKEKTGEFFYWKADYQSYNLICYCSKSSRLIFLRILAKLEENLEDVSRRIFKTFHTCSTDKNLWSVYDLQCKVPVDFKLFDYSFKTGDVELSFKRKNDFLSIKCISLANVLLRNKNLKSLFQELCKNYLKGFKCEIFEKEKEVRMEGRKRIFFKTLNNEIILSHYPDRNKIFILRFLSEEKKSKILEEILNEIGT